MANNVYEIVTNKIIEKLEQGTVPWQKPWINGSVAVNWKTQKPYRGINTILLDSGEYLTFKQVQEAKGKVKKGAKSEIVVFWKWLEKEDKVSGDVEKIPMLRYYKVFNINQCEGIESKRKEEETFEHNAIEEAENIVKGYINSPSLSWNSGRAFYQPVMDHVNVPPMKDFPKVEGYYSTLFHEFIHSTGHSSRLNRDGITSATAHFGSEEYSKEELVAEIGASMLNGLSGFVDITFDNSTAYLQSWLRNLKNDKTLIVKAASQAQRAVDYILGISYNEENKNEKAIRR
ncbi:ArdC family protein [Bacillus thuringiensis]|uniref:Zincin-like metallopeptidase domain-containing protein n=1 Tax=Bacillus thuringiensis TaxID=1428 RepID=A0AAW9JMX2_BACTU|nr:zincin-like metallopeptidase domain-containing protein [Bacillus thuringiensis]MDZ5480035.1 zincin-like metallopeptidase domain-containing protein [Bacillus thuringiensis]